MSPRLPLVVAAAAGLPWVKVGFAAAILMVGLLGALLPWWLRGRGSSEAMLAIGNTFAGGVLGGAGLIHLLGGGLEGFEKALPRVGYPLALLLAGAGFLLILLIEGVVVPARSRRAERRAAADAADAGEVGSVPGEGPGGAGAHAAADTSAQHEVSWMPRKGESAGATYPVILLVVLSVHSVILGITLGAQQTLLTAIVVFAAIVAHKSIAGFALGVGYERAGYERSRAWPQIIFFATMTPLGVMLGTGAAALASAHTGVLLEAIFDSIGAGTFLYIASLDIIRTEFESPDMRWQKWLAAVVGFAIMALLAIWI